jgi:hypothetical protein
MSVPLPVCYDCKYFNKKVTGRLKCKAYPKGIALDILDGGTHDKVRKDQVGKFVFEYKGSD